MASTDTQTGLKKPGIVWPTTLMLIITPIVPLVGIPWYQFSVGFEWSHVLAFVIVAALNGISITAGYHRLWSHNAYKAHPILRLFFALFGAAAFQNSVLTWASQHRRHHRHVDDVDEDPYSAKKGLWYSHIGWMIRHYPTNDDDFSNVKDLQRDKILVWQHKYYYAIALAMNILPPLILGWLTGDYIAHFLMAGFLRLVYSHHTTFFINSLAHYWGRQPYTHDNTARDNDLIALFTYGEGYHNYHHLFQSDYRNGVRWWQFDPTKWLIKSCSWVGLARDLRKTPTIKIREAMVVRQLEVAQQRVSDKGTAERWLDYIEREREQLGELLSEWRSTRSEWMDGQKNKLAEATCELHRALENNALMVRLQELEQAVQQQYHRLKSFNGTLAAAA